MTEAALSWRTRRDNGEVPRIQSRRRDRTPKKGDQQQMRYSSNEGNHHHSHHYQRDRGHSHKNYPNSGISQSIDRMDRDNNRKQTSNEFINGQKPVFQNSTSKKSSHVTKQPEVISPQHEELIRFVSESWEEVRKESEEAKLEESSSSSSSLYYQVKEPVECLRDFKPFDFEAWWGRRLYNSITKSVP